MSRLGLLVIAVVLAGCGLSNPSGVRPEQVAVYVAGQQPKFDSTTHKVVGQFAVTSGDAVSNARVLRNVRAEAASRGAEYVVVMGATSRGLSQQQIDQAGPQVADPESLLLPGTGVFAIAFARR